MRIDGSTSLSRALEAFFSDGQVNRTQSGSSREKHIATIFQESKGHEGRD